MKPAMHDAASEWSQHWPVPLVSALALAVSVIPIYSLGALMPAIHASTGWTRSQISTAPTLISVITVLFAPGVGWAIDRFGPRRIGLPGLVFYCLAVASIALSGPGLHTWWLTWTLVAIAYTSVKMTVWTAAVVSLFERSRGLALGTALAGLGLGSTCLPYLATVLEERFTWRGAYVGLALGGAILALPLVFAFFYARNDRPYATPGPVEPVDAPAMPPGVAFRSRRYLQMALACLCASIPSTALVVHFVPIVRAGGLPPRIAAATAGAIGITAIIGRLSGGWLLDRFSAPLIGFVSLALPVVCGPVMLVNHTAAAAIFAASMLGLSAGAEFSVLAYLIPRYFGIRHFGLLFGVMNALITAGLGIGPLLAGRFYDHFGNYNNLLLLTVPLFAASAILLGTLGRPEQLTGKATARPTPLMS